MTAAVGAEFDVGEAAKEVDTLGGYMMAQGGRLPLRGELVSGPPGFEIEVLDSDPRRIKSVRIHRSNDRKIERDREGRRRYSGPDVSSPTIAAVAPAESAGALASQDQAQSKAPQEAPTRLRPARDDRRRKPRTSLRSCASRTGWCWPGAGGAR